MARPRRPGKVGTCVPSGRRENLYWIVHQVGREKRVFIQEAGAPLFARLKAAIAGHAGAYVEHHALDDKTARKVPKKMIGRVLERREAQALLNRLAK